MKIPKIMLIICLLLSIIVISLFLVLFKKGSNDFNYNSAKNNAIKYLDINEKKLIKIANALYKDKSSKKNPYKGITYASYNEKSEINKWNEKNYIKFDLDAQGMLGGQYYGLIYSTEKNFFDSKSLVIYDEHKETGDGNNIFIRQKIKKNWYFYYDDYDGKADTNKIK